MTSDKKEEIISSKEEMENKYQETYKEQIVFDDIKFKDHFVIATKKNAKERFLIGANGIENERNSYVCYIINTKEHKEMKMVISSQEEVKIPHQHIGKFQKTSVQIFDGNDLKNSFFAFDVYIDTSDKDQLSKFLVGGYPQAQYTATLPKDKEKLFSDWHNSNEERSVLEKKFNRYHSAEIEELKSGLNLSRQLFANFIGNKDDLKIAKVSTTLMDRVKKFCKSVTDRQYIPDINILHNHYRGNNRF